MHQTTLSVLTQYLRASKYCRAVLSANLEPCCIGNLAYFQLKKEQPRLILKHLPEHYCHLCLTSASEAQPAARAVCTCGWLQRWPALVRGPGTAIPGMASCGQNGGRRSAQAQETAIRGQSHGPLRVARLLLAC